MDIDTWVKLLKGMDSTTLQALLNNDQVAQKLTGYHLYQIAQDNPGAGEKILCEKRLYQHLIPHFVFLCAKSSLRNCEKVLENPELSQFLNGQELFQLIEKFSSSATLLQLINTHPNLQKKHQAYLALCQYSLSPLPNEMSEDTTKAEKEKILGWVADADITIAHIANEKFKNLAVKHTLIDDLEKLLALNQEGLYELAINNPPLALAIITHPSLYKKFLDRYMGYLYLFWLSRKHLNVCLAILQNTETEAFLTGYNLFHLHQHYISNPTVYEAITANPSTQQKYAAYSALKNYTTDAKVTDASTREHIFTLHAQAGLLKTQTEELLSNLSVAIILLSRDLIFPSKLVIKHHPGCAPYLIDNRHAFSKAFAYKEFFEALLHVSEAVCLHALSTPDLATGFEGRTLSELVKKYGQNIFNKILEDPILLDKYRAYTDLYQLTHQKDVHIEQEQKQFRPPTIDSQDYERGVFLQTQGKPELAFRYFDKAATANYEAAISAIQNIATTLLKQKSLEVSEHHLKIAKAFADPKKLYYNEVTASQLYKRFFESTQHKPFTDLIKQEIYYHLARRSALALGGASDQKLANNLLTNFDAEHRPALIGFFIADVKERRIIEAVQVSNPLQEPAILFLHDKMASCPSPHGKAMRCVEIAQSFHTLNGYGNEVQRLLEEAATLDENALSAADYSLLADLQQSALLSNQDQKALPFSAENYILSNNLYAVKKASGDDKKRPGYITSAVTRILLICCNDESQLDKAKMLNLSLKNAATIVSLFSVCTALEPDLLYAICLKCDPPKLPILPLTRVANNAPESLDAEPAFDYISKMLEWASTEEKSMYPSAHELSAAIDRLFVLVEMLFNKTRNNDLSYQPYFHESLALLFKKLRASAFDSTQNTADQLLAAFTHCNQSSSALQKLYAEKLLNLAWHLTIGNSAGNEVDRYSKLAFLFEQGIDPNRPDAFGTTPLMQATCSTHPDPEQKILKLLLRQPDIKIEQKNPQGETAFSLALQHGEFKIAWLLISHSQIYWQRVLFISAFALTVLLGLAAALLFFIYTTIIAAAVCASVAALCLLWTCYAFCALDAVSNKTSKGLSPPHITAAILSGLGFLGTWLGALTLWTTSAPWAWSLIGVGFGLIGIAILLSILSACCRKIIFCPDFHLDMLIPQGKDPLRSSAHDFQQFLHPGYMARTDLSAAPPLHSQLIPITGTTLI